MLLIKTLKKKHLASTLKKGEFCFNMPSVFNGGVNLAPAQEDRWDSHLSFDASHIIVAPIIYKDESGPHYGTAEKLADYARIHLMLTESKHTPLCSFRKIQNSEYVWKYGAIFLRLGDVVDRIRAEFEHDSFILLDSNALLERIRKKTAFCARSVHYGDIDADFRKYIDQVGEGQAGMFQKDISYSWQQEYRIILPPQKDSDRVLIELGTIEDIAIGGDLELLQNGVFLGRDDDHVNEVYQNLERDGLTVSDVFELPSTHDH